MPGDWSQYIPEQQRREALQLRRRLRRRALMKQRRFWVQLCLTLYAIWCLKLIVSGEGFVFSLSLVPLLTLPAVGWLAWWLVYKEFNN
jgi:hypothetical protein